MKDLILRTKRGGELRRTVLELSVYDMMTIKRQQDAAIVDTSLLDEDLRILKVFFYIPLMAGSEGDEIPFDTFVQLVSKSTNEWYLAMEEINPGVLPDSKAVDKTEEEIAAQVEEALEKKE